MSKQAMFTSKTDLWATPRGFFDRLNSVFRFDLDVCALPENAKCERFFTPADDGLAQNWRGNCWMNPPYGRTIGAWVEKAYRSAKENGATVVCLLPARVDTRWWHDFCAHGEVHFVKGRLKFGAATDSAPFPSAVVVFRPTVAEALSA
jgi:phage N-6-adenine-methyltransferase